MVFLENDGAVRFGTVINTMGFQNKSWFSVKRVGAAWEIAGILRRCEPHKTIPIDILCVEPMKRWLRRSIYKKWAKFMEFDFVE